MPAFEVADYFIEAQKRVPGYTSLAVLLLVLAGFIIVSVGVVGLYVGRIFEQVKDRPLFLIDQERHPRRQHIHHLASARNRERLQDPLTVTLHQRREGLLGKHVACPPTPGSAARRPNRAISATLLEARLREPVQRDDHPVAHGGQHPIQDLVRVRQEVVEAGLEDDHVGLRKGGILTRQVEFAARPPRAGAGTPRSGD